MTNTEKLCVILKEKNPTCTLAELARIVTMSETQLRKAALGLHESPKLADYMATRYGETELRDKIYRGRQPIRHYDKVDAETHRLIPIDKDDILRFLLPVVYPQRRLFT